MSVACLVAIVLAACSSSGTPAPASAGGGSTASAPAGSTAASLPVPAGSLRLTPGPDLCTLLAPADFTAAGVPGAGPPTKNSQDPTGFFCVYAGKSSGTGGIEFDAFISAPGGSIADLDMDPFALDVTAAVAGADKAVFQANPPAIGVLAGNLLFDIGFPTSPTAKDQAIALARVVLAHAAALP